MTARRRNRDHAFVGELLRRYRRERHLTQDQLAKLLGTKDASWVRRVELGQIKSPGLARLQRISEVLDIPLSTLTGERGPDIDYEKAVRADPNLTDAQKDFLVQIYRNLSKG